MVVVVGAVVVVAAAGVVVGGTVDATIQAAADRMNNLGDIGTAMMTVVILITAVFGIVHARKRIVPELRARNLVEKVVDIFLIIASGVAILTTIGIVLSLLFEAIRFFNLIPVHEFLFGLNWSPQTALRADQVGSSGEFGAVPIFQRLVSGHYGLL